MKARQWFSVQNAASDPSLSEIHILDDIGGWDEDWVARNFGLDMGVTARGFVEMLAALPDSVNALDVHINSLGGDVQAGVTIANALRQQQSVKNRKVETYVDGIAASIASVIAMAGSKVHIADNALMMVHHPWARAAGNAQELRESADILETMSGQIVATYKWHSSLTEEQLLAMMSGDSGQGTWMGADEALANGFATDKVEAFKAVATLERSALAKLKVPEKFKARVDALLKPADQAPTPAAATDVLARVSAAGLDLAFASSLVSAGLTLEQVTARVDTAKAEKAQAAARSTEIKALCSTAKQDGLVDIFISGGLSVDGVRAALTNVTAQLDKVEIDTGLNPDAGAKANRSIDVFGSYAALNKGAS